MGKILLINDTFYAQFLHVEMRGLGTTSPLPYSDMLRCGHYGYSIRETDAVQDGRITCSQRRPPGQKDISEIYRKGAIQ